jgi:hypothetical protein
VITGFTAEDVERKETTPARHVEHLSRESGESGILDQQQKFRERVGHRK